MKYLWMALAVIGVVLALALIGCSSDSESGEHNGGSERHVQALKGPVSTVATRSPVMHSEESGTQFARSEAYDEVRAGARLILSYDSAANAFTGTVENTTVATLSRVRVEVHLSNGTELGPTTPVDLAPGQAVDVTLEATEEPFTSWSAHPEVGGGSESGEHSGDSESGEHS